jgi:hypothetical protein
MRTCGNSSLALALPLDGNLIPLLRHLFSRRTIDKHSTSAAVDRSFVSFKFHAQPTWCAFSWYAPARVSYLSPVQLGSHRTTSQSEFIVITVMVRSSTPGYRRSTFNRTPLVHLCDHLARHPLLLFLFQLLLRLDNHLLGFHRVLRVTQVIVGGEQTSGKGQHGEHKRDQHEVPSGIVVSCSRTIPTKSVPVHPIRTDPKRTNRPATHLG